MSTIKRRKLIGNIILSILILIAIVLVVLSLHLYIENVDAKAKEILEQTDIDYTLSIDQETSEGFYKIDIQKQLTLLVEEQGVSTVTCLFPQDDSYIEVKAQRDDAGELNFEIEKIGNENYKVKTRTSFKDVTSIEYRSGNYTEASVIKIISGDEFQYFAMATGINYFLGDDIKSISYMNDHFYYLSYNPRYKALKDATSCTDELRTSIKGFKESDYFYTYGKINFLSDFYQKLASKKFTVKEQCELLNTQSGEITQ